MSTNFEGSPVVVVLKSLAGVRRQLMAPAVHGQSVCPLAEHVDRILEVTVIENSDRIPEVNESPSP